MKRELNSAQLAKVRQLLFSDKPLEERSEDVFRAFEIITTYGKENPKLIQGKYHLLKRKGEEIIISRRKKFTPYLSHSYSINFSDETYACIAEDIFYLYDFLPERKNNGIYKPVYWLGKKCSEMFLKSIDAQLAEIENRVRKDEAKKAQEDLRTKGLFPKGSALPGLKLASKGLNLASGLNLGPR